MTDFTRLRRSAVQRAGALADADIRAQEAAAAVAGAVGLQRVLDVVRVLAAELRVAGVDRRIAFGAVAVHAGLAGAALR